MLELRSSSTLGERFNVYIWVDMYSVISVTSRPPLRRSLTASPFAPRVRSLAEHLGVEA